MVQGKDEGSDEGVSRRSFLALAGALAIGRFSLPEVGDGEGGAGPTRRLIGAPGRWGPGDANLMWMEVGSSGEAVTRFWMPEGEEEVAEAEAFFSAASKVDWDAVVLADVPIAGDPTAPRRFELVEGTSAKFWEVTPLESGFRVRFGKVGTAGQSQEKSFPDPEAAAKALGKLVVEKVRKGYVEVSPAPEPPAPRKARSESDGPPDWATEEAWSQVLDGLDVGIRIGKKPAFPTPEELDAFEAATEFKLPASYRAFIRVFGPGTFSGATVQIYAPGAEYREMGAKQAEFAEHAADLDFLSDRESQAEPITHMIIFAEDVCPRYFGWDVREVRDPAAGEYAIREYDPDYFTCPIVANSFPEFINEFVLVRRAGVSGDDEEARRYFREDGKRAAKPPGKTATKPAAPKPPAKKAKRSPVEERALMMAIVAAPDDPAPWLAYADWLDGFKDKLGPLIRLRLGGPEAADPALEAKLIAGLNKSWNEELIAVGLLPAFLERLGDRSQVYVDQGQVTHMRLVGDLINARVLAAFASAPALASLEFEDHRLTTEEVETLSRIASVRKLHAHSELAVDDFAAIARMTGLEFLCMDEHSIPAEGLRHLAALPGLSGLHFGVDGPVGIPAGLEALPALTYLSLSPSNDRPKGLKGLGRLGRLEWLALARNPIRSIDLAHLAGLGRLKRLDLSGTKVTNVGLAHLSSLTNLEHLNLTDTKITAAGLAHLEALTSLETLDHDINALGDAGLASIGKLTNLRKLQVSDNSERPRITAAGFAHLRHLTRLVELQFEDANPTDADLAHLSGMVELERLTFRWSTKIAGPGLAHLASLARLKYLDLDGAKLTDAAVEPLSALTWLKNLSIRYCPISAEGMERLRAALPNTQF